MTTSLLTATQPPHDMAIVGLVLSRDRDRADTSFGELDPSWPLGIAFDPEAGITLPAKPAARAAGCDAGGLAVLLRRMRLRDESALNALHVACAERLISVALRIVGRREIACEAVSSAFLQAWQSAADFDDRRANVFTWLSMIVRSRALDLLRQSKVRSQHECALFELDFEAIEGVPLEPCRGIEQSRERVGLRRAMATLAPVQRQVLSLIFLEGRTHEEAAAHIGLALGTVKSHARRGLAALRAHTALRAAHA